MKFSRDLLIIVLTCAFCALVFFAFRQIDNVQAQSGRERFEYCALSRSHYAVPSKDGFWITYFNQSGLEIVDIEESATEKGDALAKAIARLGEQGWEMVGEGFLPVRTKDANAIYFKRKKP